VSMMSGLSVLAIWVGFFWLYRDYEIDRYRQRLFELRDELWDYAAEGHVAFDNPAYRLIRIRINGLIRFAHMLSCTWLVMALVAEKLRPSPEVIDKIEGEMVGALNSLPAPLYERLRDYQKRALFLAIEHTVRTSPFFWVALVPFLLVALISLCWRFGGAIARRLPVRTLVDTEAALQGAV
jgi:hypothetical protein